MIAAVLCLPLAACVDTASQVRVEPAAAASRIARRPGVSPRGATVALASVSGGPQDANDRFAQAFAQAAAAQDMTTVEPAKAGYLARIYIDAGGAEQGATRFSYVVDLFDRSKKRVARLTAALERDLPQAEFHAPEGGYFMWVELPEGTDIDKVFAAANERGVAIVKGTDFLLEGGKNTLRLAYSGVTEDQIDEGVSRLADAVAAAANG